MPLADLTLAKIYGLIDPTTRVIRYVGKANNPAERLRKHLRCHQKCHRINWIQSLVSSGLQPELVILEEVYKRNPCSDTPERYILWFNCAYPPYVSH